jgi:hypothetical protein
MSLPSPEPFLTQGPRGTFVPAPHARGPWGEDSLHGRILAGLFAREFERTHGDPGFQPARLTVDLFRLPRIQPLTVRVDVVREGRRIRVLAGVIESEGREVARAIGVWLRRGEPHTGRVWSPEPWDAPPPDATPPTPPREGGFDPPWEMRPIGGPAFGTAGRKRAWLRDTRELVAGEPLSPFARVALAADIASPMANSGEDGLAYVNADITLYLHRLPVGEWLGFDVTHHHAAEGVAVGGCAIHDETGPIGTSNVSAVVNARRR